MTQHFTLQRMVFHRRLLSLSIAVLILVPSFASSKSVQGIVDTSSKTVTRASFLSWSLIALDVKKEDGTCRLPYSRVPRGLKQTLCTVQTQGALSVFGASTQYPLNRPITRGEALIVLTALTKLQERADVSAFTDVKGGTQEQAVANAIALKWMQPQKSDVFGFQQLLTGIESLSLLQAASKQLPVTVKTISIPLKNPASGSLSQQDLLDAVWYHIKRDYIHAEKIDENESSYKAIEAVVNSLNDPYSTFFRPTRASDFQSQINGEVTGIGAHVEDISGNVTIVAPLPGSPAEKAGIQSGDIILEADGVALTGLGLDKSVSRIRGERGTVVQLKIRRSGNDMMFSVTRDLVSIPEVQVSWQGDIAIVQIIQFGQITVDTIRTTFTDIAKRNPRGIILDLRNNGGGLLSAADILMSNFVPRGTVVARVQSRFDITEEITEDEPTVLASTKMVVLVNKGSASASEIVAGALQDLKRATIVGSTTFGKGTVQEIIGFRTGEALKLTIAEWLTPLGRRIDKVGVQPDYIIESTNRDEQLRRALEIVR